jgi:hypothetical protein
LLLAKEKHHTRFQQARIGEEQRSNFPTIVKQNRLGVMQQLMNEEIWLTLVDGSRHDGQHIPADW